MVEDVEALESSGNSSISRRYKRIRDEVGRKCTKMSKVFPKFGEAARPNVPPGISDCVLSGLAGFEWQAICSNRRVTPWCVAEVKCMSPLVVQSPIC